MVVVRFLLEFSDQIVLTVPVGISDTRSAAGHAPLKDFIMRLREKCGFKCPVELRYKNLTKVNPAEWSPHKDEGDFLMGIIDEPASEHALQYRENMVRSIRSNSQIGKAPPPSVIQAAPGTTAHNGVVTIDPTKSTGNSRVEVLDDDADDNKGAAAAASKDGHTKKTVQQQQQQQPSPLLDDSEDDDDYDPRGGEHVSAVDAVHFIAHSNTGNFTSVSKVAGAFGTVLFSEGPQLSPMYPSSLVDIVRRDPRLKHWVQQLDTSPEAMPGRTIEKMESALHGVSSEEYSQYLYVAKRRGHTVQAKKDEECEVAFYSVTDSVMHSCAPSGFVRYKKVKVVAPDNHDEEEEKGDDEEKGAAAAAASASSKSKTTKTEQIAVVRCARYAGLTAGDMLSVALPRVSFMDFFLLPTSRRRRYIQEQYLLKEECVCPRCTARVSEGQSTLEVALTGAFFEGGPSKREQTSLTLQMKKGFEALKIMAPAANAHSAKARTAHEPLVLSIDARAGKTPADKVQQLYDFVVKYTHNLHVPPHLQHQHQQKPHKSTEDDDADAAAGGAEGGSDDKKKEKEDEVDTTSDKKLLLHPQHWRLSMVRLALLAFLFPPQRCKKIPRVSPAADRQADIAGLPTKHSSVKLDQLVVRMCLAQLEVESAAIAKSADSAHPVLRRSYVLLRYILALLPEKLAADVQVQARSLPSVDWTMLESVAKM